jgi:hypothetical protein
METEVEVMVDQLPAGQMERIVHPSVAEQLPGNPAGDEFYGLAQVARMLSMSTLAPRELRGQPETAFHLALVARDFGISLSSALAEIYIIEGKPSPSPQLCMAQVERLGLGCIKPGAVTRESATALAFGPGATAPFNEENPQFLGSFTFTWEDAQDAELVNPGCRPGVHCDECKRGQHSDQRAQRAKACKENYRHYARNMLFWRAVGFLVDMQFPGARGGLYSPDELGAVTDAQGRYVDVKSVDLPEGYDKPPTPPPSPADPAVIADLVRRAKALPEGNRDVLRGELATTEGYTTLDKIPQKLVAIVTGRIARQEAVAKAAGWTPLADTDTEPVVDPDTGDDPPAVCETCQHTHKPGPCMGECVDCAVAIQGDPVQAQFEADMDAADRATGEMAWKAPVREHVPGTCRSCGEPFTDGKEVYDKDGKCTKCPF